MWQEIGLNFGLAFVVVYVVVFGAFSLMPIILSARSREELRYSLSRISTAARFGILLSLLSLSFFVFSASSAVHLLRDYSSMTFPQRMEVFREFADIADEIPAVEEWMNKPLNPPLQLNLWREGLTGDEIQAVMDGWNE